MSWRMNVEGLRGGKVLLSFFDSSFIAKTEATAGILSSRPFELSVISVWSEPLEFGGQRKTFRDLQRGSLYTLTSSYWLKNRLTAYNRVS